MLIIDELAAQKFAETLATLRLDPGATRYLYFSFKNAPATTSLKSVVIESTRQHLSDGDAHLYCFDDGDMCLLAKSLPSKDGRQIMLDVGAHLGWPVTEQWVSFFDLNTGLNRLLVLIDSKLEKIRIIEEEARKRKEKETHERKRHAILNATSTAAAEDIHRRRTQRHSPHLMMIEDDVFSSKLVENVLKKHYPITTLHNANGALKLYAELAPDLLFLDINLPDVTGHELLARILAIDPNAYIIMLSGNADRENILQAMSKGAKGFVAKPFTREKLIQYIDRCPTIHHPEKEPAHAHD